MSASWMGYFFDNQDKRLQGSLLLTALAIADHADSDGRCWPSVERLAEKVRKQDRQVRRLIKDLEDLGYVSIDRGQGRGKPSVYQLKKVSPATPFIESDEPENLSPTTPFIPEKPVTHDTFSRTEKVTFRDIKGDISAHTLYEPLEPSYSAKAGGDAAERKPSQDLEPVERRIWRDGVELLHRNGLVESSARTFLGGLASKHGKLALAEAIAATQAANPADPRTYITGILSQRERRNVDMQIGKWDGEDTFSPPPPCPLCGSDVCLGGRKCDELAAARAATNGATI